MLSKPNRKLNDFWAAALHIITVSVVLTIYILKSESSKNATKIFDHIQNPSIGLFLFTILEIISISLGLLFIPKQLLHISFFVLPFISVGISIYFYNIVSIIISIIYSIFSIITYFFIRNNIKYTSVIASSTIKNVFKNSISLFVFILFSTCFILIFCLVYLLCRIDLNAPFNRNEHLYYAGLYFIFAWSVVNLHYMLRVYTSSVISYSLLNVNENTLSLILSSIYNLFFSFGSICFASLLVAIVLLLRYLVNDENNRNRRQPALLAIIADFLLSVLESFIRYSNEWSLIYVALYGKSFVSSTKESWKLLFEGSGKMILNDYILGITLSNFFILHIIFCISYYFATSNIFYAPKFFFEFAFHTILLGCFIDTIETVAKTLLFLYCEDPDSIKEKDEELYEALVNQEHKH